VHCADGQSVAAVWYVFCTLSCHSLHKWTRPSLFLRTCSLNWVCKLSVNSHTGLHVLRTSRALIIIVSLQTINAKHSHNDCVCCQWTCHVTGSTFQFSSCAVNKPLACDTVSLCLSYKVQFCVSSDIICSIMHNIMHMPSVIWHCWLGTGKSI